jgi:hypothetical protein
MWSKQAEAVRDGRGDLVAWEDGRLFIDDLDEDESDAEADEESEAA